MSKFINVQSRRQKELRIQFPDLQKLDAAEESAAYHYFAVSVFDHWLSREEAEDLLDDITEDEQSRRNLLFRAFNDKVIQNTEILHFTDRGNYRVYHKFRSFSSAEALRDYLNPTAIQRFKAVLPQLNMVYYEGWDDTNVFYARGLKHKKQIETWAIEAGLHILEQHNY